MAYRAQRLVVATSTDDLTESYKFIPSLLEAFGKKNPGSTVAYEKDEQNHFVRAFIMPNAMSLALLCMQQIYGIKVINYDSVSYTGALVLLIGRDGNLQSQVLAFALLPNSEMEQMKWFLSMTISAGVRYDGCPVFCSHNQNGLLRALAHEARNAKIMFCVRSLIDEINRDKSIPRLGALEELVWEMQRQDTEEGFHKVLSHLESLNAPAAAFLRAVHPKNWTYYHNRSIRLFKWSSTAAEEAISGSEILSSDEAPFDMMYGFLAFLMDNIFKKNQLAHKMLAENPLLTPGADATYRQELQDLHFGNEAMLMEAFDSIYKAATYAEVCRNLRIEIPAAEDLNKDSSLLPAASLKGAKYRKRARPSSSEGPVASKAPPGLTLPMVMNVNAPMAMGLSMPSHMLPPAAKAPPGLTLPMVMNVNAPMAMGLSMPSHMLPPAAKVPRLDFDPEVVSGLTELV
ncbi:hypothetical protein ATCC90586_008940 [Pythium insidiosum]|nr:hypothetical protein ATCC90586_008940 [Pythium insidiosum]